MVEPKRSAKKPREPFLMPSNGIRYILSNGIAGTYFGPPESLQSHLQQQERIQLKKSQDKFHKVFVINSNQNKDS